MAERERAASAPPAAVRGRRDAGPHAASRHRIATGRRPAWWAACSSGPVDGWPGPMPCPPPSMPPGSSAVIPPPEPPPLRSAG